MSISSLRPVASGLPMPVTGIAGQPLIRWRPAASWSFGTLGPRLPPSRAGLPVVWASSSVVSRLLYPSSRGLDSEVSHQDHGVRRSFLVGRLGLVIARGAGRPPRALLGASEVSVPWC